MNLFSKDGVYNYTACTGCIAIAPAGTNEVIYDDAVVVVVVDAAVGVVVIAVVADGAERVIVVDVVVGVFSCIAVSVLCVAHHVVA